MNKAEFRKKMLSRSETLSEEECRTGDEKIYKAFFSLAQYFGADKVFAYVGTGSEVSTVSIIEKLIRDGKEVYVPLCHGCGEMDAVRISDITELSPGRYGIPEPSSEGSKIQPEKLDMIIVPGVAFGEDFSRLGRGGGYYDRFLKKARKATRVALCREINIEETVPHEPHDESVDIIVTEVRTVKK